jgi:hypothetical protein
VLKAVITDILGIVNIVMDIADITIDITDIIVETGRRVQSVTKVSRNRA